jgi:hypothetical protein
VYWLRTDCTNCVLTVYWLCTDCAECVLNLYWLRTDCILTAYWLRTDCVLTAYWLRTLYWLCTDLYWLCTDSVLTVYWLCAECVQDLYWLPNDSVLRVCLLCTDCVLCTDWYWLRTDCILTVYWICTDCVLTVYWLCNDCVMTSSSVLDRYSYLLIPRSGILLVKLIYSKYFQTRKYISNTAQLSREHSVASLYNVNNRTVYCGVMCLGLCASDTWSGLSATVNKVFGDITQYLQANVWTVHSLGLKIFLINLFPVFNYPTIPDYM